MVCRIDVFRTRALHSTVAQCRCAKKTSALPDRSRITGVRLAKVAYSSASSKSVSRMRMMARSRVSGMAKGHDCSARIADDSSGTISGAEGMGASGARAAETGRNGA
ncbi:hypothetical protein AMAG_17676 [Allomyces macrogynus ATCC 38327]|uniref:Uncharacterized protein n=1 Tax=Allomyces macrogynus (strain ATCC 38327) TaxID=578462 RepID=A0A0L0RW13_ALLM3|nr:hypothetical protein AMAG_17676 [Allomyces macrogynus ATCC 38327]|eukprot:KNE54488.1 hypothetical protein AMAG_17676 [Allomyces macrogynus ATCC 38327]